MSVNVFKNSSGAKSQKKVFCIKKSKKLSFKKFYRLITSTKMFYTFCQNVATVGAVI